MTTKATHLIIVCCHSIYTGGVSGNLYNESNWLLKSFQKSTSTKEGEHETLIRHIFAAIRIHSEHPDNSIIIFSGAATSYSHPELSEAQSYLDAWEALKAVGEVAKGVVDAKGNVILEENATDFYQNLLFSVVKFRNMNGQYPSHITIIAPAFKKARCLELHAKAIKWPTSQLTFHGIDPPFASEEREQTIKSEYENGYSAFEKDLYGRGTFLMGKKKERRWREGVIDELCGSIPENEVRDLLRWDGGESGREVLPQKLPWED